MNETRPRDQEKKDQRDKMNLRMETYTDGGTGRERDQWSGCILLANDQRHVPPSVFRQTHK